MSSAEEHGGAPGTWLLAGASGFLGSALADDLHRRGIPVRRLVRSDPSSPGEHRWDPDSGTLDPSVFDDVAVVVNLAGVSVQKRWTEANRAAILDSRVNTTRTLADGLARLTDKPVYLAQSATGFYPKNTGTRLTEADTTPSTGFLGDVVLAWEAAADSARSAGVRVVHPRTGVVLDQSGGALPPLSIPFKLGAGIPLGSGRQVMPVIGLADWLAAIYFVADTAGIAGPVNLVIPERVTNLAFTDALVAALHRPRIPFLRVPAAPLELVLGGFSSELLDSVDLAPQVLLDAGFTFSAPTIRSLLDAALAKH
jgi:uncharacterized protein (TIGR01777 family)